MDAGFSLKTSAKHQRQPSRVIKHAGHKKVASAVKPDDQNGLQFR
jgi:hypothetical protein